MCSVQPMIQLNMWSVCSVQPMLDGSAGFVCWARGFLELGPAPAPAQLQEALQRYSSSPGTPPLLLFPEEDTTNGRAGMLKFRFVSISPFRSVTSLII